MDYSAEVRQRFDTALRTRDSNDEHGGTVFCGEAEDRTLGVWIRARLTVTDGIIRAASCDVFGCPETIAAAQWVAQQLAGRRVAGFDGIDVHAVSAALDVPAEKLGKLLRLEDAVLSAVEQARALN